MLISSKLKAEKSASNFLAEYYLETPNQVSLLDILGSEGLIYNERNLKSSLGSLIRHGSFGQILVNSKIKNETQKRFVISHELGHWKMHYDIPLFNCDKEKFKYWDESISNIEREANWFAAEFLMPKNIFKSKCKGRTICKDFICELAEYFKVSLTSSLIRFAEYGNESVMIIYSNLNKIKWFTHSKDFPFRFYQKPIFCSTPLKSITREYYNANCVNDDSYNEPDVIRAMDWFEKDFSVKEDIYLNELIIPIPTYKSCLTILWQNELNFVKFE